MAIYRCEVKVVKRSGGRSATAASAYRAGALIHDERSGIRHDYRRKSGVAHTEILTPASAPAWASDRAKLWNEVEQTERRKDSQLAREVLVSIPTELSATQSIALVKEYAQGFVNLGMVVDLAVHDIDSHNPHCHMMLTMRDLGPDGFGKKNRGWNDRTEVQEWRERWAKMANAALEKSGSNERVDHRSLKDQGIAREPQSKLGPNVLGLERRTGETSRLRQALWQAGKAVPPMPKPRPAGARGHSVTADTQQNAVAQSVPHDRSGGVATGAERPTVRPRPQINDDMEDPDAQRTRRARALALSAECYAAADQIAEAVEHDTERAAKPPPRRLVGGSRIVFGRRVQRVPARRSGDSRERQAVRVLQRAESRPGRAADEVQQLAARPRQVIKLKPQQPARRPLWRRLIQLPGRLIDALGGGGKVIEAREIAQRLEAERKRAEAARAAKPVTPKPPAKPKRQRTPEEREALKRWLQEQGRKADPDYKPETKPAPAPAEKPKPEVNQVKPKPKPKPDPYAGLDFYERERARASEIAAEGKRNLERWKKDPSSRPPKMSPEFKKAHEMQERRKHRAAQRLSIAVDRGINATTQEEKAAAKKWADVWARRAGLTKNRKGPRTRFKP